MKKILCCVLSLTLLFALIPTKANAVSQEQEDLIELACSVFPEYSDKIINPSPPASTYSRTQDTPSLIVNESRAVSETETLMYSEYSDGTVLLTDWEVTANSPTVTIEDRYSSSYAVNYTVTLKATCAHVTGYFELQNAKFSLINNAYDQITDTGTEVRSGNCTNSSVSCKAVESSTPANITCDLIFRFADYSTSIVETNLVLKVSGNGYSVSHTRVD